MTVSDEQIATELGVDVDTVAGYFTTGSLRGRLIGGHWRTTRGEVDRWLLGHDPNGAIDPPFRFPLDFS